jgi:hypothetical protein
MEAFPFMSKRFAMTRFLGLTEEEIEENSKLWFEEREQAEDTDVKGSDLRSIGISAGDMETDLETAENLPDEEGQEAGMPPEIGPAVAGPEAVPPGGAPPPPAPG